MTKTLSPFDGLIVECSRVTLREQTRPDNVRILVTEQLKLLRAAYLLISQTTTELDSQIKAVSLISSEKLVATEDIILGGWSTEYHKSVLLYFSFVGLVNRFCEAVKRHSHKKGFPDADRIKFFRDKVEEHWDEYVKIVEAGLIVTKGKFPVVAVGVVGSPDDRRRARDKLVNEFQRQGIEIAIPDHFLPSGTSANREYADLIYNALECAGWPKRDDELVRALFDFGFPPPILDVEEYAEHLVKYLTGIVEFG